MDKLDNGVIMFQLTAARRRLHTQRTLCAVQLVFQLTAARRRLPHAARTHSPRHAFQLTAARRRLRQLHQRRHDTRQRFNSQPPEGGCNASRTPTRNNLCFNSQPPEGGCEPSARTLRMRCKFQLTAARRRLHFHPLPRGFRALVSTHRRPKAAAPRPYSVLPSVHRFNSQPPEGGCWTGQTNVVGLPASFQLTAARRRLHGIKAVAILSCSFQLTAARRRLLFYYSFPVRYGQFQLTAARRRLRPKRAGGWWEKWFQLTAARRRLLCNSVARSANDCFNSQPPEGGCTRHGEHRFFRSVSTHSRPKAAALARLFLPHLCFVSTHSRPKAAACSPRLPTCCWLSFNSQPPEGGCNVCDRVLSKRLVSTHSRPKAAAHRRTAPMKDLTVSTHSRPKAAAPECFIVERQGGVSTHSRPKAAARTAST